MIDAKVTHFFEMIPTLFGIPKAKDKSFLLKDGLIYEH
jgi:hypothetical protein